MLDRGWSNPWWIVALAVVGGVLVGVPRRQDGTSPPAMPSRTAWQEGREYRERHVLDLLSDFAGVERACGISELKDQLRTQWKLDGMIVSVPDPIDSVLGFRVDLRLDALTKAMAAQEFTLDRYYLPWDEFRQPPQGRTPKQIAELDRRFRQEPGVLLFRRSESNGRRTLRLVFVVGETPASGIHKPAFRKAACCLRTLTDCPSEVRILGPTYTGSADSLAISVRSLLASSDQQAACCGPAGKCTKLPAIEKVRIVTGTATAIDHEDFLKVADPDCSGRVTFQATILPTEVVRDRLLEYIVERHSNFSKPLHIAWLEESTQFGKGESDNASNEEDHNDGYELITFPFPLHVSRVRSAYDSDRSEKQTMRPRLGPDRFRLNIPFDENQAARDVLPQFAPRVTASTVELGLAQIFATINRDDIQYLGITATDPRDQIFLAGMLREYCPDVQLLLLTSELLYTHPDYAQYLSGTIVAGSYPLYFNNQHWSFPYRGEDHHVVSSNELQQGVYNAAQALFDCPEELIEYGYPFDFTQEAKDSETRPPVWISVVGRYGLWPLDVSRAEDLHGEARKSVENAVYGAPISALDPCRLDDVEHFNIRLPMLAVITISGLLAFVAYNVGACWRSGLLGKASGDREVHGFAEYFRPPRDRRGSWFFHLCVCLLPLYLLTLYLFLLLATPLVAKTQLQEPSRHQVIASSVAATFVIGGVVAACRCLQLMHDENKEEIHRKRRQIPARQGHDDNQKQKQSTAAVLLFVLLLAAAVALGVLGFSSWSHLAHMLKLFRESFLLLLAVILSFTILLSLLRSFAWWRQNDKDHARNNADRPKKDGGTRRSAPVIFAVLIQVAVVILIVRFFCYGGPNAANVAAILHFDRAVHLSSGLSPLIPVAGVLIAFYLWGWMRLKRRVLWDNYRVETPWPEEEPNRLRKRLQDAHNDLAKTIESPCFNLRKRSLVAYLIVFGIVLAWIAFLWLHATAVFDDAWFSILLWLFITGFLVLWMHWFWGTIAFARMVLRLLRNLSWLPFQYAFIRLPDKVTTKIHRFLRPQRPGVRNRTIRERYLEQISLDLQTLHSTIGTHERSDQARMKEFQTALKANLETVTTEIAELNKLAANQESGSGDAATHRKNLIKAVNDGSRRIWKCLASSWPEKDIQDAYPRFKREGDVEQAPDRAKEGTFAALVERAEEFLAIQVVTYAVQYFAHMRNYLYVLGAATIAFFIAVISYPPHPQRALLYTGVAMVLATSILAMYVIVKVEKDELLSRVRKTTPNQIQFDWGFFGAMILLLLPAISIFFSRFFPNTWSWLFSWVEPALRAIN